MAKRSFYVFLTSILGALLFLILDRMVAFFYLYLVANGYVSVNINYYQFAVWDIFSLIVVMLLGAWYGIWLGLYWFEKVYVEKSHGGLVHHISSRYFPLARPKNPPSQMAALKQRLQSDLWELENLQQPTMAQSARPQPIKRRVVRKSAPRKLGSG